MKKILSTILTIALVVGCITVAPVATKDVKAETAWEVVWSDEFDGTELNRDVWNVEVNGNGGGNEELQFYVDDEDNIKVSDGTLKLTALKESYGNKSYTSGRINTRNKKTFKYGKIEARIKLPQFSGAWPAFWTLGQSYNTVGWPRCGEIDIMEAINAENFTHGAIHWNVESVEYNGQGDSSRSSERRLPVDYQRTDWHTYSIVWTEDKISWYVDDILFFAQGISSASMSEFRAEHFIILNLAIGGRWPGYNIDTSAFPDKSVMEVDYVRVYNEVEIPTTTVTEDEEVKAPARAKIKSATKKSEAKKVKLSIKKVKGAKGYRVQISAKKNFNKKIVNKIVKNIKVTISNKKFKKAKKLFVRVKAYKLDGTKKVWSKKWSIVKKVKINK